MRDHPVGTPRTAVVVCAALLMGLAAPGGRRPAAIALPAASGNERVEAARLMARAMDSVKALRQARGLAIDPVLDPNATGLIGDEFTPLTTSLGEVEAKRTSANPAFAAVLVRYFRDAGLRRGDVVAVGASGSFPALALATLCASRAIGLEPIVIYSIGSSMYGANLPRFTLVDWLARLRADGILPYHLAAVSPGGGEDRGTGVLFDEEGTSLVDEARASGLPLVGGASLADAVARRLRIYNAAAAGRPIRCYVNVGGASASFGTTPDSLALPNGLVRKPASSPGSPTRGVVFEFAARGTPVVHLLFVRGIARDNHVPFDPIPLPPVGVGEVYTAGSDRGAR